MNKIFLDENTGGKGRYFKTRFLQPGLVKYSFGVCLLEKETIDKFIYNFVGCPVIISHQDVTDENAKDLRVGVISRVWYESADGWYWGEGVIIDKKALELINDGFNVSCQYEITEYAKNDGKLHNGNEYDKVILNGKPEHLAIVENPRYENAMIAVNALEVENFNPNHDKDGKFAEILAEKMKDKEEKEKEKEKEKKEEKTIEDKLKETDVAKLHFEMQQEKAKNAIIQAINEIKDNNMFRCLFKKKENVMDKEEMKSIFMECLTELTASNEADKKEDGKEAENKCKNEEPDYKKLYEELKAKMEKAQNEEDEDKEEVLEEKVEKEAENKAKNSIEKQKELINGGKVESKITYITQAKARELGKELF